MRYNQPVHDYQDGFFLINGTEYYKPLESPMPDTKDINGNLVKPHCVCGWGDTTVKITTSSGSFYCCGNRHGDPNKFLDKYLQDMKVLLEHKNQLKLFNP